jgi:hypothetical protein
MGRKRVYDESLLRNNPFVESPDFEIKTKVLSSETSYVDVRDISDGVILALPSKLKSKFVVETSSYCKVYNKKGLYLHIAQLSPTAKALFLHIQYNLQHNKDYIHLPSNATMKEAEIKSLNTFKKCLEELTTSLIITPTLCTNVFWINPVFFFNGSRINKYSHKLKEE